MWANPVYWQQPGWLWASVAGAVPLVLTALRGRPSRGAWASAVVRALAVALVGAALAGPVVRLGGRRLPVLVLADVSASVVRPPMVNVAGPVERYDFAAGLVPTGQGQETSQTRLGPVLEYAASRRGSCAGVVIATDGRFTDADWPSAAAKLGATGLAVRIVPAANAPADAALLRLDARRRPDGQVDILVEACANAPLARTLAVQRTGPAPSELLARTYQLSPDAPLRLSLVDSQAPPAACTYQARLLEDEAVTANNALIAQAGPVEARVAVLADAADAAAIAAALPAGVVTTLAPADVPDRPWAWGDYSAVILEAPVIGSLSADQRQGLADFVEAGGAMVLLGAAPGSCAADLADPLTRTAALRENPLRRPGLDLAVVLDASGSMAGASDRGGAAFATAAAAVSALTNHLGPRDRLTVITFGPRPAIAYQSPPEGTDSDALAAALAAVTPAGPTDLAPALVLASTPAAPDRQKMVLVVSDLATQPLDLRALATGLTAARAKLAVVAVDSGQPSRPAPLEALVSAVGGTLTRRADLAGLDEVFATLVRREKGPLTRQGSFRPVPARGGWDYPPPPQPIGAYVPAAASPDAQTALEVEGDPLLACRPVGLGRSAALAIDPRQSADLTASPWLARLLADLLDWSAPRGDPRLSGQVDFTDGQPTLRVEARDSAGPVNGLELSADWLGPDHSPRATRLEQVGPGRYEAPLGPDASGTVIVHNAMGRCVLTLSAGRSCAPELARIGPDLQALGMLADLTGGRLLAPGEPVGDMHRSAGRDASAVLLGTGLALMLADWLAGSAWVRYRTFRRNSTPTPTS